MAAKQTKPDKPQVADQDHSPAEKPVSLKPLKFEDAVKGLFKAKRAKEGR